MFSAKILDDGSIAFAGRLDASQIDKANDILTKVSTSQKLDLRELEYISSAGLGILLAHQKRLKESGHALLLINLNMHVKEIFILTGFDQIFEIK